MAHSTPPQDPSHLPLAVLKLSVRPYNALRRGGIDTVADLLRYRQQHDLQAIPLVGPGAVAEIEARLAPYLSVSAPIPAVPVQSEFELLDFSVAEGPEPALPLPAPDAAEADSVVIPVDFDYLPELNRFAQRYLTAHRGERTYEILKRRMSLEGSGSYTLQQVGDSLNLTRERVRQLEERALAKLHAALKANQRGSQDKRDLILGQMMSHWVDIIEQQDGVLTESEIIALFQYIFATTVTEQTRPVLWLLCSILKMTPMPRHLPTTNFIFIPGWAQKTFNKKSFYETARIIYTFLRKAQHAVPFFDIKIAVRRKLGGRFDDERLMRLALRIGQGIEAIEGDAYQLSFASLSSDAEQAFRILQTAGAPMDIKAIMREINHNLVVAGSEQQVQPRSLQNQLVDDERFVPVGRSGVWSLQSWEQINTRTILTILENVFHYYKRPLTADELYEAARSIRDNISRNTIMAYLSTRNDLFIRTSETHYELTRWGNRVHQSERSKQYATHRQQIEKQLQALLLKAPDQTLPITALVTKIVNSTQLSKAMIRRRIEKADFVEVFTETHPYTRKVRLLKEGEIRSGGRRTIREAVQAATRAYLRQRRTPYLPLSDVVNHVMSHTKHPSKPTIYRYIAEMSDLVKEERDNVIVCTLLDEG